MNSIHVQNMNKKMELSNIFYYRSKKKKVYPIIQDLIFFIDTYFRKSDLYQKLFLDASKIINVPKSILEKRSKQIMFRSYQFKEKKFTSGFKFFYIFVDYIKCLILVIFLVINYFIYRKVSPKKFDLICENIYSSTDVKRHTLFAKKFRKILFLGYSNLNVKNKNIFFLNTKKNFLNFIDLSFKNRILLLLFLHKVFFYSLFCRTNIFYIFKNIIYDYIKYKKIYSIYRGKYYFNYRFYDTNVLQNYLFKENGGSKTSCFQKNICILSLSCYIFTDIFFSLGKNHGKICNRLGGEIKSFIPVGSFSMESSWFKQKNDLKKIPNIDVLIIGINAPWPRGCINNDFHNSYYNKFLPWIKRLSYDFPERNFYYKHHNYFKGDSREKDILADSNINIIVNDQSLNSTYGWAFKSQIVLSFASTMIVELLGNKKISYFIDPGGINDQWFYGIKNLKKYRIKTYNSLKKLIQFKKKVTIKVNNPNYYCLSSKNTVKKISNFLKKNENYTN